jgi:putative ABC transport system permease protein
LTNDGLQKAAVGMAGDPVVEDQLLMLGKAIQPGGRYLSGSRELIMGADLAKSLHHVVGDTVRLMTVGADGALHLRKLTLVGIFDTGVKAFDERMFQVGLDDARALLRMGEGTQQLVVWLKDYEQTKAVAERLRANPALKEVSVLPWSEIGEVYSLTQMAGSLYGFIFMLIAFLGAIIIGNIMMMVILERRHEIGILRAMGFNRRETLLLFLMEGGMLGAIGSAAGGSLGFLLTVWLHSHGVDFSDMATMRGFPMDSTIYFKADPLAVLRAVALGTGVATLMSALPSWRATRLNIVDAIKAS